MFWRWNQTWTAAPGDALPVACTVWVRPHTAGNEIVGAVRRGFQKVERMPKRSAD